MHFFVDAVRGFAYIDFIGSAPDKAQRSKKMKKTNAEKLESLRLTARRAFYNAKNVGKFMQSRRLDAWAARYEILAEKVEAEGGTVYAKCIREAIA